MDRDGDGDVLDELEGVDVLRLLILLLLLNVEGKGEEGE